MAKLNTNYGVEQIKTLEGIEAIRLRPGMEEYNRLFNFYKTQYNKSFIKFINNENVEEKEDVIRFFSFFYPQCKFYLSYENTAIFYKLKE